MEAGAKTSLRALGLTSRSASTMNRESLKGPERLDNLRLCIIHVFDSERIILVNDIWSKEKAPISADVVVDRLGIRNQRSLERKMGYSGGITVGVRGRVSSE